MKKILFILLAFLPVFAISQVVQRAGGTSGTTMVYPTAGVPYSSGTAWSTSRVMQAATSTSTTIIPAWSGVKIYADSIGALFERLANKSNVTGTSTTKYATQNLVKAYCDSVAALLQRITNLSTATSTSTTKYPSWSGAKAYTDSVAALLSRIVTPTFTTKITTPVATLTSTDTSSGTFAVGTLFYRVADSAVWVKIRLDGTLGARWKKLTP